GECDSTNMILIGEKDGATLGALWLNSECYRYRVTSKTIRPGVQPTLAPRAEVRHVRAVVWLGIQSTLGNSTVSVTGLATLAAQPQNDVGVAFVYGDDDAKGKAMATRCQTVLAKLTKKDSLTGAKGITGTGAVGSTLLEGSPEAVRWVADYVRQAMERGKANEPLAGWNETFMWRSPGAATTLLPARALGERVIRFDIYARFLR
ncbi:MAG TPA: hypothetical protein VEL76_35565, partial [Gemmataceae bacterium]|nr:hypothetical protein [Gemmataceae bacterium]